MSYTSSSSSHHSSSSASESQSINSSSQTDTKNTNTETIMPQKFVNVNKQIIPKTRALTSPRREHNVNEKFEVIKVPIDQVQQTGLVSNNSTKEQQQQNWNFGGDYSNQTLYHYSSPYQTMDYAYKYSGACPSRTEYNLHQDYTQQYPLPQMNPFYYHESYSYNDSGFDYGYPYCHPNLLPGKVPIIYPTQSNIFKDRQENLSAKPLNQLVNKEEENILKRVNIRDNTNNNI